MYLIELMPLHFKQRHLALGNLFFVVSNPNTFRVPNILPVYIFSYHLIFSCRASFLLQSRHPEFLCMIIEGVKVKILPHLRHCTLYLRGWFRKIESTFIFPNVSPISIILFISFFLQTLFRGLAFFKIIFILCRAYL